MGSWSSIFSLKTAVVSASVLAAAVALRVATPGFAEFLSVETPRMYCSLRAWLTPPYLYFVINGIIISIAASSRFQKASADSAGSALPPANPAVVRMDFAPPVEYGMEVEMDVRPEFAAVLEYGGGEMVVIGPELAAATEYGGGETIVVRPEFAAATEYGGGETIVVRPEFAAVTDYGGGETVLKAEEEEAAEGEEEFVISRSNWSPKRRESREIPTVYSVVSEKPLVSVRFGHRKSVKASPEGKALGVARSKRNGTLENTWKAITDGRAVPLARHLKKSDTWGDVHGRGRDEAAAPHGRGRDEAAAEAPPPPQPMRKSETFNVRGGRTSPSGSSASPAAGRLKREPSLGQDDLNRRVEAFIKKFNEEMRLQRQESFVNYMDMINRGSG